MSRTSYHDGESHEKRISKHRVSDDEMFECVSSSSPRLCLLNLGSKLCAPSSVSPPDDLVFEPRKRLISPNTLSFRLRARFRSVYHRYLGYLIQPKTLAARYDPHAEAREREREREQPRISSLSSSIYSIGDLFKDLREGPKSAKFPKDLVKVLENKLQLIAMGKDPGCVVTSSSPSRRKANVMYICRYSDQLVRRTMAVFYGQVKDDNFRRQMKENRKIEDIILMFATNATNVLKKDPSLAGDKWKSELNNQIALFVKLLRDCLRGLSHVSPELTQRLDAYTTKLVPQQQSGTSYSDSGYDSSSTNRDRDSVASPNRISRNIADMPLVLTVARLFKIPEHALQGEVDQISKFCTEKVVFFFLVRGSR